MKKEILDNLYKVCLSRFNDLEPWPYYFKRRYLEFLSYNDVFEENQFELGKVLEVGCGIGFYSAFFASSSKYVIATDLEIESVENHTPGLDRARRILTELNYDNFEVKEASLTSLPFEDNSFDFVFSSHVLEHVPNPELAIQEISRVLKPSGIHFCVVPTRTDRIVCFFTHQLYLMKRFIKRVGIFFKVSKSDLNKNARKIDFTKRTSNVRYFPFPPPHGVSDHYFKELKLWSITGWTDLITQNGKFQTLVKQSSQINILFPFIAIISHSLALRFYSNLRRIECKLGKRSFFMKFGINLIVATRNEKD